jgi:restriction system protein
MNDSCIIPRYDYFFEPTVKVLKLLGGSGNVQEIYDKVCDLENFSEKQQSLLHKDGPQTEIAYRMAWARTYLKNYGVVENTQRGIWSLTDKGRKLNKFDKEDIKQKVRENYNNSKVKNNTDKIKSEECIEEDIEIKEDPQLMPVSSEEWIEKLLSILCVIPADAFERLCQRILRESGFIKVEVTGQKGDGGIDGIGVLKIALLSFQVFFQCKRYSGSVGPSEIRDFRGAMVGRTDKGLFMTTGTFTRAAKQEATRDGAPALDLIDGEQLCHILKDLNLGVTTKTIEVVDISESWFNSL